MKGRTYTMVSAVLLFLLSACSSTPSSDDIEIEENIARLKAWESLDVATVSSAVEEAQRKLAHKNDKDMNYHEVFKNSVVMGDSIAAGLEEYGLLTSMTVVAARGKNLATIDDEINTVIGLAPKHIFFSYGMNDLGYCNGDTDLFIERYRAVIDEIKAKLPKTTLHINAILPIQQHAIDANPLYVKYTEFNDALQNLCKELKIDYIDNSSIIKNNEIPYNDDGVHPIFDFFPLWLNHMAERL